MSNSKVIVIVPGLWMGSRPYELLVAELKRKAPSLADVIVAPISSTGTASPGNPTMQDDAIGIRNIIQPPVESGKRVVMVCHSAGAFLGGMATEDLEIGEKLAAPSGGGVERFVFIVGGLLPKGAPHPEMNMPLEVEDGKAYPPNREETLFHDVDPELTAKYMASFECQSAEGWGVGSCTYTGWDKVPTNYIKPRTTKSWVLSRKKCALAWLGLRYSAFLLDTCLN